VFLPEVRIDLATSMAAFTIGALLPMLMILLPSDWRIGATAVSVAIALAITGLLSARFAGADVRRAIGRNVAGGVLAMAVTYGIGSLVGATVV